MKKTLVYTVIVMFFTAMTTFAVPSDSFAKGPKADKEAAKECKDIADPTKKDECVKNAGKKDKKDKKEKKGKKDKKPKKAKKGKK